MKIFKAAAYIIMYIKMRENFLSEYFRFFKF